MKKKTVLFLVIILCLSLFVGCASKDESTVGTSPGTEGTSTAAETYTIKIAHGAAETTAMHQGWLNFKKIVEEKSQGKMTVEIYGNQQLGGDREAIEAVQLGNITMACPSTAPLAAFDSAFYVLDIPFLFADRESAYAKFDGEAGTELLGTLSEYKIKGLAFWENGFRNLTNSKIAIRKPSDLAGMKIRTMENEIHMAAWKLLGANPTPMAFGELYTALQQKTVDGQENPFELIYATKFHEVQKYITKTQHIYSAYIPLINEEYFNALPSEYQTIIIDAMKESTGFMREIAQANDVKFEEEMKSTNEVIELTPEEQKAFRDEMKPIVEMVKEKVGEELVNAFV
ncbi:MAG: DctP family TRAP transporter solute-binding subunit, partial [Sedimentibacter sp.]